MSTPALQTLAARLGEALLALDWRVCTVESCTGGLIAGAITEIAGSSGWFERGFVTYSNEAKHELVGVLPATLAAHGAVSEPVAREMALGALRASRAHLALSVTGVAGPGGGSPAKPVGTVCFGWATAQRVEVTTCLFGGDRAAIRYASVEYSLRRALGLLSAHDAGSTGQFA